MQENVLFHVFAPSVCPAYSDVAVLRTYTLCAPRPERTMPDVSSSAQRLSSLEAALWSRPVSPA